MGGAMSWVSEKNLVAAISNAGGFGVIACGAMTPEMLAEQIAGTQALTDKPFGVNLITMHPQLDELIRVTLEAKVGHIVLAGGIPPGTAVRAVKDGGAKLIAFAPALSLAKRLVRSGADAIVIEGSEAGGHIGPVSLTRAGAGNPAAFARGAGIRRRWPRPRRGHPGLPGNGRLGRAARHPVRRGGRIDRAPELQEGLHPRQCPRRAAVGGTGPAAAGDPGARPGQRRAPRVPGPPGGNAGQVPRRRADQGGGATG